MTSSRFHKKATVAEVIFCFNQAEVTSAQAFCG